MASPNIKEQLNQPWPQQRPWWLGGYPSEEDTVAPSMEEAARRLNVSIGKPESVDKLSVPKYLWWKLMQGIAPEPKTIGEGTEILGTGGIPATIAGGGPIWKGGGIWGKGLKDLDPNIANQLAKTMRPDVKAGLAEKFKNFQGRPTFSQITSTIEQNPELSAWADQARLAASGKTRNIVPTRNVIQLEPEYFAKRVSVGPIEDTINKIPTETGLPIKKFLERQQKFREILQENAPSGEIIPFLEKSSLKRSPVINQFKGRELFFQELDDLGYIPKSQYEEMWKRGGPEKFEPSNWEIFSRKARDELQAILGADQKYLDKIKEYLKTKPELGLETKLGKDGRYYVVTKQNFKFPPNFPDPSKK
jgi:hypothetical protein